MRLDFGTGRCVGWKGKSRLETPVLCMTTYINTEFGMTIKGLLGQNMTGVGVVELRELNIIDVDIRPNTS